MISESAPWRDELRKASVRLLRWDRQKKWTSRTYFLAERDVLMGAYSIRRLIESGKSSSQLPAKGIRVRRYARVGRKLMLLDRFSPELFYDIDHPFRAEMSVARLCNQIIHSFVFQIYLEGDSTSVVFVSDLDRDKHLNGISFNDLAGLFDYVGRETILQTNGTMRDGVQSITNVTNHDVVESGGAVYSDEERVSVDWAGSTAEAFRAFELQMIAERLRDAMPSMGDRGEDQG